MPDRKKWLSQDDRDFLFFFVWGVVSWLMGFCTAGVFHA